MASSKELKKENKFLEEKLGIANKNVCEQIARITDLLDRNEELVKSNDALREYIKTVEKHMRIAEKAIERKDKQFLGLRMAYADEVINGGE